MATIEKQAPTRRMPDSAYSTLNRALANIYTLDWEFVAYTLIFMAAMVSRLWDLGARVMSHDESLHTYYSYQLYERGDFDHTPLMHGPLLFHMTALGYFLFGVNDFSGRIYAAILGVGVVMFPLLFRRWLGKTGAILTSLGLMVSPMLLYYSRYIRHDIPTMFFALTMLYAILQYVDGEKPRRPIWIAVLGAAMSLMLASKEVSFMYIAIFGSFFTLFWLMRMMQGLSFAVSARKKAEPIGSKLFYFILGQGLAFLSAGVMGFHIGYMIWQFWVVNRDPTPISQRGIQLLVAALIYAGFHAIGGLTFVLRGRYTDVGTMMANGLRRPNSAMLLIIAGTVLGSVFTLITVTTIDIIKPEVIWQEVTYRERIEEQAFQLEDPIEQQAYLTQYLPPTGAKIEALSREYNHDNFIRASVWIATPILLIVFAMIIIAILKSPRGIFSLQDFFAILMIAFIISGILIVAEQRSVHSHEQHTLNERLEKEQDRKEEILKQRLGEDYVAPEEEKPNDIYVAITLFIGAVLATLVATSRLMTNLWDYLNRQPIFDILIVMGTLILPWTAALPLFLAGYQLDQVPIGQDMIRQAILVSIAYFMVSVAVGLSWNWKWWALASVAFWLPFVVFFTTFFTNGNGLGTGVIGSLGYWLEQQGVRRGSQPQYYYTLVQMPIYEYLPLIISSVAAFFGISYVFEFRARSRAAEEQAEYDEARLVHLNELAGDPEVELDKEDYEFLAEANLLSHIQEQHDEVYDPRPRWLQPYSPRIENALRKKHFEYLGDIPFMQFMAYWAIIIFVALTMAGEKMPWLTSHITLPLIFIGGWYMGRVVERIRWPEVRLGGWVLMAILVPVFMIALVQLGLPYFTGTDKPFQGDTQFELENTGQWLAAFFGVLVTGYFIVRSALVMNWGQSVRLVFSSLALMLLFITARHAWMASYLNYDYATELLVYAHSGPAVKTTMEDIDNIASRHPDGERIAIVYDEESTWPFVWYLRDYDNLTYVTTEGIRSNPAQLEGALVVISGEGKNADVERYLSDDYYKYDYIRLWWPMQEYFNLNFERIAELFEPQEVYPASTLYRRGLWNIWWDRNYDTYGQAKCLEREANSQCIVDNSDPANPVFGQECIDQQVARCLTDHTPSTDEVDREFGVEDWPVRDKLFVYIHKDFAVRIWDTGLDGQSVAERLKPDPENTVYQSIEPLSSVGDGVLRNPRDLAIDAEGNVYVADTENRRVLVFDTDGLQRRIIGEGVIGVPWGVAVSPLDGNIYVANTFPLETNSIMVFNPEGDLVNQFGQFGRPSDPNFTEAATMFGPRNITVDLDGYIYVVDTGGHRVRIYDPEFNHIRDIGGEGTGFGQMLEPVGIVVHHISGEIYVAETWNRRISVYNREGTILRTWEVNMWEGTTVTSQRPYLAVSPDGTIILVADMDASEGNNGPRVVAYDLSGQAILSFNATGGSPFFVDAVAGIDVAPDGRVYVVDSATSRVVVFPPLSVIGNLAPNAHPDYPQQGSVGADITDTIEDDPETLAAIFTGIQYLQALITADYEGYNQLFCSTMTTPTQTQFTEQIAVGYFGMGLPEVNVQAEIMGRIAIITWDGNLIVAPGTEFESRRPASEIPPLRLVKRDDRWLICNAEIFRPGS